MAALEEPSMSLFRLPLTLYLFCLDLEIICSINNFPKIAKKIFTMSFRHCRHPSPFCYLYIFLFCWYLCVCVIFQVSMIHINYDKKCGIKMNWKYFYSVLPLSTSSVPARCSFNWRKREKIWMNFIKEIIIKALHQSTTIEVNFLWNILKNVRSDEKYSERMNEFGWQKLQVY